MASRWMPRAATALAVCALFGCGGGDDDGSSQDAGGGGVPKPTADQTLTIMGFGPGDEVANSRIDVAKKAIAPAKVKNPKGGFNDQQFLASLASENAPDLIYLDRFKIGTYAAKNTLQPLSSCIKDQQIDMGQYRESAVREVTFKDEVYGIPEFSQDRTLILNEDVLKRAGIKPEDFSTTDWDKLTQMTRQLSKTSGGKLTTIGFDPKLPEFFPLWAKANGIDILSEDGLEANLDDPKAVEALAFAKSLVDAQGGWGRFKAFRDGWDYFGEENPVAEDQIGVTPYESWYYNVLADVSPKVNVIAKPFTDRQGQPINYQSGSGWAIPRAAKNASLACTWIKTITSVDAWMAAARARLSANAKAKVPFTGLYTANKTADDKIFAELYKPTSKTFDAAVQVLRDVQDKGFGIPPSPAGAEVQQAWQDAANRVLGGQASPQEALAQAQKEAQSAIDAAKG